MIYSAHDAVVCASCERELDGCWCTTVRSKHLGDYTQLCRHCRAWTVYSLEADISREMEGE
jgi:hypothetical protein